MSNPWVNANGDIVHPNAPAGGGGAGPFANAGPLDNLDNESGLPHPLSPFGRHVVPMAGIWVAQNETKFGKKSLATAVVMERPVTLKEFNNKGPAKYVASLSKGNVMGVHPKFNFAWVNAVEIAFSINRKLATRKGIKEFRARQNVVSAELWQRELKDGKVTPWVKMVATGEEPDDPDPGLQTITRSTVAYHDAPGFTATSTDSQFMGPAEKETSPHAVYLFLRQNFTGWIDGAKGSGKRKQWLQVSDNVQWHSNQSLMRNIFSSTAPWSAGDGCEIELGHTEGQPK